MTTNPRHPRLSRYRAGAALSIAALVLTGCSTSGTAPSDSATGEGPAKFVYDVGSGSAAISMAPYTAVPEELGYWDAQDLDVDIVYSDGSSAALQSLIGGRADIVVSGTNATYSTAMEDPDLRIVSLIPENVWRIAVTEESTVTSIPDLKGLTIGVISLTSGSYTYGRSIVQSAGLDPETDVEWLPIGSGSQAAEAIESGRVAAYSSYDGPLDIVDNLTANGLRPVPSELDKVAGSLGYVVTRSTLEERPDEIVRFLRGTYEAMEFSRENPEAAVQIYWERNPEQKPTDADEDAAIQEALAITHNSWSNRAAPGDDDIWGYLRPDRVTLAADFFAEYRIVEGTPDPDVTVDMTLTQEASTFDISKVHADADAWKAAP